jgi:hypothetical protein
MRRKKYKRKINQKKLTKKGEKYGPSGNRRSVVAGTTITKTIIKNNKEERKNGTKKYRTTTFPVNHTSNM